MACLTPLGHCRSERSAAAYWWRLGPRDGEAGLACSRQRKARGSMVSKEDVGMLQVGETASWVSSNCLCSDLRVL